VLDDLRAHPRCAQVQRVLQRAHPTSSRTPSTRSASTNRADRRRRGTREPLPELPLVVDRLAGASASAPRSSTRATPRPAATRTRRPPPAVGTRLVPEGRCPTVRALLAAGRARQGRRRRPRGGLGPPGTASMHPDRRTRRVP
jgi:hypothetical protein